MNLQLCSISEFWPLVFVPSWDIRCAVDIIRIMLIDMNRPGLSVSLSMTKACWRMWPKYVAMNERECPFQDGVLLHTHTDKNENLKCWKILNRFPNMGMARSNKLGTNNLKEMTPYFNCSFYIIRYFISFWTWFTGRIESNETSTVCSTFTRFCREALAFIARISVSGSEISKWT